MKTIKDYTDEELEVYYVVLNRLEADGITMEHEKEAIFCGRLAIEKEIVEREQNDS